jgi:hypothetical protein
MLWGGRARDYGRSTPPTHAPGTREYIGLGTARASLSAAGQLQRLALVLEVRLLPRDRGALCLPPMTLGGKGMPARKLSETSAHPTAHAEETASEEPPTD